MAPLSPAEKEEIFEKASKDLAEHLMDEAGVGKLPPEVFREKVAHIPLKYRSLAEAEKNKSDAVAENFKQVVKSYLSRKEQLYKAMGLFGYYLGLASSDPQYAVKKFREKNPNYANYVRDVGDLRQFYESSSAAYKEAWNPVSDALSYMISLRYKFAELVPGVPKPKIEMGKKNVVRTEILTLVSLASAFLLLFVYLRNPPGTAGFAVLPSYGTTTILLSIIVFVALIFLFKKHR